MRRIFRIGILYESTISARTIIDLPTLSALLKIKLATIIDNEPYFTLVNTLVLTGKNNLYN